MSKRTHRMVAKAVDATLRQRSRNACGRLRAFAPVLETLEQRLFVAGPLAPDGSELYFSTSLLGGTGFEQAEYGSGDTSSGSTPDSPLPGIEPESLEPSDADTGQTTGGGSGSENRDGEGASQPQQPSEFTRDLLQLDESGLPLPESESSSEMTNIGGELSVSTDPIDSVASAEPFCGTSSAATLGEILNGSSESPDRLSQSSYSMESGGSAPSAPASLSASISYPYQISLAWADVDDESGYTLERSTDPAFVSDLVSTTLPADMTSQVVTGLTNNVQYYFRLNAFNDYGISDYGNVASATTIAAGAMPNTPGSFQATAASESQINLSWQDTNNYYPFLETGYIIDRSTSSDFTQNFLRVTAPANSTSYSVSSLQSGTPYYFRIFAISTSGWSNVASASATTQAQQSNPPTIATPATASLTGMSTVQLSVLGADDGGEPNLTYTWSVSAPPGAPAPVFATGNGTNSAKNMTAEISAGGSYTFVATVRDAGGQSTTSSAGVTVSQTATSVAVSPATASVPRGLAQPFTAVVLDQFEAAVSPQPAITWSLDSGGIGSINATGLYTAPPDVTGSAIVRATSGALSGTADVSVILQQVPATPTNVAAVVDQYPTNIRITWEHISTDETGFTLEWATDAAFVSDLATMDLTSGATSATVSGLLENVTYYFRLRAYNAAGHSAYGNTASAKTQTMGNWLSAPSSLQANVTSDSQMTLAWSDNNYYPPESHYQIDRSTSSDFAQGFVRALIPGDSTSYSAAGLDPGTTYYFRVFAINDDAWSDPAEAYATTTGQLPLAPVISSPPVATQASTTTAALSVTATDNGGEDKLIYIWSLAEGPEDAPDPVFDPANGTNQGRTLKATLFAAGDYTFRVTVRDPSALTATSTAEITVAQVLAGIRLDPPTAKLMFGETMQFTATTVDQFGAATASQPEILWSMDSGGIGALSADGLYTAPGQVGMATVRASGAGISGSSIVSVTSALPAAPPITMPTDDHWTSGHVGGTASSLVPLERDASGNLILHERDYLIAWTEHPFLIPARPSKLLFQYEGPNFDSTAPNRMRDAFEVALLAPDGTSLVPVFAPGRDAFFNVSEGLQAPAASSGVEWFSNENTVELDISQIPAGTMAKLVFRVISNDGDTNGSVKIITHQEPPTVTAQLAVDTAPVGPGTAIWRTDGLTSDYRVIGTAKDDYGLEKLEGRADGIGEWQAISLAADGSFAWAPSGLAAGAHTVEIRATDRVGLTTAQCVSFIVNAAPVASAGADREVEVNTQITFDAAASSDNEGIYSYDWTMPDGTNYRSTSIDGTRPSESTVSYLFTSPGLYPVTLTVTDTAGEVAMHQVLVTVGTGGPSTGPVSIQTPLNERVEGTEIEVQASFTDAVGTSGHIAVISWGDGTFDDGNVTESGGSGNVSGSHVYADNGTYTVTVSVKTADGSPGSAVGQVVISNQDPTLQAGIGYTTVKSGTNEYLDIVLQGRFTDPGFSRESANTRETFTVSVDWGDGTIQALTSSVIDGSAAHPSAGTFRADHRYQSAGIKNGVVTVTDDDGGSDSYPFDIGVASISLNPKINLKSNGKLSVSLAGLNLTDVDANSLRLGPAGATPIDGIDSSGTAQFYKYRTGIQALDRVVFLTGLVNNGGRPVQFVALQPIEVVSGSQEGKPGIKPGTSKFYVADAGTVPIDGTPYHAIFGYNTLGQSTSTAVYSPIFEGDAAGAPVISRPTGIASNRNGSRLWTVQTVDGETASVLVYGPGADENAVSVVGSWHATGLSNPQGITTNQVSADMPGDIWVVDADLKQVLWYDSNAGLARAGEFPGIPQFPLNPDNDNPTDLVTIDGSIFWVLQDHEGTTPDEVFVYDAFGALVGRWQLDDENLDARGLTLDPTRASDDIWVVDRSDLAVYAYSSGTELRFPTTAQQFASSSFPLATGNSQPEAIADPEPAVVPVASWHPTVETARPSGVPGTEYWLMVPPETTAVGTNQAFVHISADEGTAGVIDFPSLGYSAEFEVAAGETTVVDVPLKFGDTPTGVTFVNDMTDRLVHVTTGKPVTVRFYRPLYPLRGDGFAALPVSAWGRQYVIVPDSVDAGVYSAAIVLAAQDCKIIVSKSGQSPYSVQLHSGVGYRVSGLGMELTGTRLVSESGIPFAVLVDNFAETPGTGDPSTASEFLLPVELWGNEYYSTPSAQFTGGGRDAFVLYAAEPNTVIQLTDSSGFALDPVRLGTADHPAMYDERVLLNGTHFVTQDGKPFLVAQLYTPGTHALQYLSPLSVASRSYSFVVEDRDPNAGWFPPLSPDGQYRTYVSVILSSDPDAIASLRIDGAAPNPSLFSPIGSTGRAGAAIPVTPGMHSISIGQGFSFSASVSGYFKSWDMSPSASYVLPLATPRRAVDLGRLTITPGQATARVGSPYSFTATLRDIGGKPVVGAAITFRVTGDAGAWQLVTDDKGEAVFSYTSDHVGVGNVIATSSIASAVAGVTWVASDALTIHVDDPADGSTFMTGQTVLVTGQADALGIPVLSVAVNGRPVDALDSRGRFFARVDIQEGNNVLQFTATDARGQIASCTLALSGAASVPPDFSALSGDGFNYSIIYGRTSYAEAHSRLLVDVTVMNDGSSSIRLPAVLTVLSGNPDVDVEEPSGYTPEGDAYLALTTADGLGIATNHSSAPVTAMFSTESGLQFTPAFGLLGSANHAPAVTTVPVPYGTVASRYSYDLSASDPDKDPLEYRVVADPRIAGDTGFDIDTGELTWEYPEAGSYSVRIRATDPFGAYAEQSFTLTVDQETPNRPPVFTSVPITQVTWNEPYNYHAHAFDADPTDVISYAVSGMAELTGNSQTGEISNTSTLPLGLHRITVSATDGTYTATQEFDLLVLAGPDNPRPLFVTKPVPTTVIAGEEFRYAAKAIDPSDQLTYSVMEGPKSDPGTSSDDFRLEAGSQNTFTWTPRVADVGVHTVVLRVTDTAGSFDLQTFELRVVANDATKLAQISGNVFTDADGDGLQGEQEAGRQNVTVFLDTNNNGTRETYEPAVLTGADGAYRFEELAPGDYIVSILPPTGYYVTAPFIGRRNVTVVTSSVRNDFGVAAKPSDSEPVFVTQPEGKELQVGGSWLYPSKAVDPDGDPVRYSLLLPPPNLRVDAATGEVSFLPDAAQQGDIPVTLFATDPDGHQATQTFTLSVSGAVAPGNHIPVIASTPVIMASVGQQYVYRVIAFDADKDPLAFGFGSQRPTGMQWDGDLITWTPAAPGPQQVSLVVSDGRGGSTEQSFTVTVSGQPLNHIPVIVSSPATVARINPHGIGYQYQVEAIDQDAGDQLSYALRNHASLPSAISFSQTTGLLTWDLSDAEAEADYPIVIDVSDGGSLSTQSYLLHVTQNHAPVVSSLPEQSAYAGATFSVALPVSDVDGDKLSYQLLTDVSAWDVAFISPSGAFLWRPSDDDIRTAPYSFAFSATDPYGETVQGTIAVRVIEDNVAPVVTVSVSPGSHTFDFNTAYTKDEVDWPQARITVTALDNVGLDNRSILVTFGGVPVEMVWDSYFRRWEGLAWIHAPGTYLAEASVSDTHRNTGSDLDEYHAYQTVAPPTAAITTPDGTEESPGQVALVGEIRGTAKGDNTGEGAFASYTLQVSARDGSLSRVIKTGTTAVDSGVLGTLDTSALPNGDYCLTLIVTNVSGRSSSATVYFVVASDAKVGNLRFGETDVTIPVAGIPLTLSRSYDSLNAQRNGDFGYGWNYDLSMEIREGREYRAPMPLDMLDEDYFSKSRPHTLSIRTPSASFERREVQGIGSVYTDPSRDVWMTLPNGQRTRFRFYLLDSDGIARFAPEPGVQAKLEIDGPRQVSTRSLGSAGDVHYWAHLGLSEGDVLGATGLVISEQELIAKYDIPGYVLTTEDGTKFYFRKEEDPATAGSTWPRIYDTNGIPTDGIYSYVKNVYVGAPKLTRIVDSNGNIVVITPGGITAQGTGLSIKLDRDDQGRISAARDGSGKLLVQYRYDDQGDLIQVERTVRMNLDGTPAEVTKTSYHYEYVGSRSTHRITHITSDSGKTPIINEYDGETGRLISTTDAFGNRIEYGHNVSSHEEVVVDRTGGTTLYGYDDIGNVKYVIGPLGQKTEYDYIVRDGVTTRLVEHERTGILGTDRSQILEKTYRYDDHDNRKSERYEVDGVVYMQVWEYATVAEKQVLISSASTSGQATLNHYDSAGNLQQTVTTSCTINTETGVGSPYASWDAGAQTFGPAIAIFSKNTFAYDIRDQFPGSFGRVEASTQWQKIDSAWVKSTRSLSFYDARGFLVETQQQKSLGGAPVNWQTTARTAYTLDSRGNTVEVIQYKAGVDGQFTVPLPSSQTHYDELGRAVSTSTFSGKYDASGAPIYLSTNTLFNEDGQVDTTFDPRGNYTVNTYDLLGQVTETKSYSQTGVPLSTTSTEYNDDGKVITSWDALGNPSHTYYDLAGRTMRTVSADWTSTETLYDSAGRAYFTSDRHEATVNADGSVNVRGTLSIFDLAGRVTETRRIEGVTLFVLETDSANHIIRLTLAAGKDLADLQQYPPISSSHTHYNSLGQVDYSVSETEQRTEYVYDTAGRQTDTIQKAVPVFNPATGQTVLTDLTTSTRYDGLGRAYLAIDAKGHSTETIFDDQGRVSRTIYHNSTGDSFVAYGYDSLGRKVWQSDQLAAGATQQQIDDSKTSYQYDDRGNLIAVTLPDPDADGPMPKPRYVYTYDQYGNQTRQIDANASKLLDADLATVTEAQYDAVPHTRFVYDPLTGQRIGRTLPAVDGVTVSEGWEYDKLGRQTKHIDFDGQATTYQYDSLGRVQYERRYGAGIDPEASGSVASETTLNDYNDELGRRRAVIITNSAGTITRREVYGYDNESRLTSVSSPESVINYAYNPATGRLTDTWTSSLDAVNPTPQTSSTWTQYAYDNLGRLKAVTAKRLLGQDRNLVTTYSYDAVGNLAAVLQPNGVRTIYTYDDLNRLDLLETTNAAGKPLFEQDYDLRADGQRESVLEKRWDGISPEPRSTTFIDWSYDALDRLISETRDEGDDSLQNGNDYTDVYTLDLVGNRLEKDHDGLTEGVPDDEMITYTYNERDQLVGEDSSINANDVTYEYDANGSQTLKSTAAGDTVYKWDLRGRMVGIDTNDDGTADVTYAYDSDGVRVSQAANGDTTYYLQDKQNPTGYAKAIEDRTDTRSNGSIDATTSYILGLQVIGQADASAVYYLLLDGHGSTVALTGTNGALVEEYAYSAFGEAIGFDANTAKTNWLFGGDGIWDAKSQMTYHLARWRDGHRFVSYDSFEADPSSPAALHKYMFPGANPVRTADPSGHVGLVDLVVKLGINFVLSTIDIAATVTALKGLKHELFPITDITAADVSTYDKGLARLSDDVYLDQPQGRTPWKIAGSDELAQMGLTHSDFEGSSFFAALYVDDTSNPKRYVLAFRGTDDLGDMDANLVQGALGLGFGTQYDRAVGLAKRIDKRIRAMGGADLTMTGHSLGGGLASAAALATNRRGVTFNAAGLNGFSQLWLGGYSYSRSVTNYSVKGEFLTGTQKHTLAPEAFGDLYEIEPADGDKDLSMFDLHRMRSVLHALGITDMG